MKKRLRMLPLAFMAAALAWGVAMFCLSLQTAEQSAALSTGLIAWLLKVLRITGYVPADLDHFVRKTAHFCMFALEGALLTGTFLSRRRRWKARRCALTSAAVCAPLCVLNELCQTFAEGRSCEFGDMCIDFAGALCGIVFALIADLCVKRLLKKH